MQKLTQETATLGAHNLAQNQGYLNNVRLTWPESDGAVTDREDTVQQINELNAELSELSELNESQQHVDKQIVE